MDGTTKPPDVTPDDLRRSITGVPPAVVDEMAVPSYLHGNPIIRRLMRRRLEVAKEFCLARPFATAMDFGTGSGIMLPFLARHAKRVVAVDIELRAARDLCSRFELDTVELMSGDDARARLEPATFELLTCLDVLEHVVELDAMVDWLADLVAPGGRIVISAPTETALYKLGRVVAGFGDKGHYHHWTAKGVFASVERRFRTTAARRLWPWLRLFEVRVFERR